MTTRDRAGGAAPEADNAQSSLPGDVQLYTPAQAAERLAVKESWLRRKAGSRSISCTFIGKHLRFSEDDLREILRTGRILNRSEERHYSGHRLPRHRS
ncbi:helix-turn-helix domain-containing protein [Saccharopolyspora cebuensis]|uniref:Helix-turn-helix domain-containing protein n=1 Tax=Saccharopolyspora cebuensis TaxID=418759 RepID=A0ABV4CL43_9PSEU